MYHTVSSNNSNIRFVLYFDTKCIKMCESQWWKTTAHVWLTDWLTTDGQHTSGAAGKLRGLSATAKTPQSSRVHGDMGGFQLPFIQWHHQPSLIFIACYKNMSCLVAIEAMRNKRWLWWWWCYNKLKREDLKKSVQEKCIPMTEHKTVTINKDQRFSLDWEK